MLKKLYVYFSKLEVYKRFLTSYILILIIPIIFSFVVYNQALKTIEEDAIETRLFMIGHIRDSIDQHFINLDNHSETVMVDSRVNRLLSYESPKEGSADMYWFYQFFEGFKNEGIRNNDMDSSFYMFFKKSQAVYFSEGMSFGFEKFYNDYLNIDGVDYNHWYGQYMQIKYFKSVLPTIELNSGTSKKAYIPYLTSIPIGKETDINGLILYLIDEQKIVNLLDGVNASNMGWTYISSEDGTLISTTNKDRGVVEYDKDTLQGYSLKVINGERMLCIYAKSNYSNWTYTNVLPVSEVMGKAKTIRQIAMVMIFIAFVIGVLMAIVLSYINTRPVKAVLTTLKEFFRYDSKGISRENDYEFLQGSIHKLIKNNHVMNESIKHQLEVLTNVFWDKVFNGQFHDSNEMQALMEHLGIDYTNQSFVVVVVKFNRHDIVLNTEILSELDLFRASIEKTLYDFLGSNCYIHLLNENEAAIMINFDVADEQNTKKTVVETLKKISNAISSNFSIIPIFGIGNTCGSVMSLQTSLNEAQQALNSSVEQTQTDNNIFLYQDIKTEKVVYYYPNSVEQKLVSCAKFGKYDEIDLLLMEIDEQNYSKRILSNVMEKMLFNDMCSTLIKLLQDTALELQDFDMNMFEYKSKQEFFDKIRNAYQQICKAIVETKKDHNIKLIQQIFEFVQHNYTDSNMCVNMVASKFGLSESYFSQFFKDNANINFSSYVENARIQKACDLMNATNLSLDEISRQIGYNNTHTFRRAFKKVVGIVPSAYKK